MFYDNTRKENLIWNDGIDDAISETDKHINRYVLLFSTVVAKTTAKTRKNHHGKHRRFSDFITFFKRNSIYEQKKDNKRLLLNQEPYLKIISELCRDDGCDVNLTRSEKRQIFDTFNTYVEEPEDLFAYILVWAGGLFLVFMSFLWIVFGKRFFSSPACLIWFGSFAVTVFGTFLEMVIHGKIKNPGIQLYCLVNTDDCMNALDNEKSIIEALIKEPEQTAVTDKNSDSKKETKEERYKKMSLSELQNELRKEYVITEHFFYILQTFPYKNPKNNKKELILDPDCKINNDYNHLVMLYLTEVKNHSTNNTTLINVLFKMNDNVDYLSKYLKSFTDKKLLKDFAKFIGDKENQLSN